MRHLFIVLLFVLLTSAAAYPAFGQQASLDLKRITAREQLSQLLDDVGPKINVAFKRSKKDPFSFIGQLSKGITNAESLEIVINVQPEEIISFRIYPHYKGRYINVDRVKNRVGLMRQLLLLSHKAFLYWGVDESYDVFAGYTVTLESGFPPEVLSVVLHSIKNTDSFIGKLKLFIDGSSSRATLNLSL